MKEQDQIAIIKQALAVAEAKATNGVGVGQVATSIKFHTLPESVRERLTKTYGTQERCIAVPNTQVPIQGVGRPSAFIMDRELFKRVLVAERGHVYGNVAGTIGAGKVDTVITWREFVDTYLGDTPSLKGQSIRLNFESDPAAIFRMGPRGFKKVALRYFRIEPNREGLFCVRSPYPAADKVNRYLREVI